jgi:hypothetical protein
MRGLKQRELDWSFMIYNFDFAPGKNFVQKKSHGLLREAVQRAGALEFTRKSRPKQSARGLTHSMTLRAFQKSSCRAQRLGLSTLRSTATEDGRWPPTAFLNVTANCYFKP